MSKATLSKVDKTRFDRALLQMMDVPSKEGPVVLNKSVLQVAVGSKGNKGLVHLTKKATQARIQKDMQTPVVTKAGGKPVPRIIALATNWLIAKGVRPRGFSADQRLWWRSQVSQACDQIMRARQRSRAFLAAGWLWAASMLSPHVPGNTLNIGKKGVPLVGNGGAADSFAKAAARNKLFAGVYNTSKGADKICTVGVLQLALNGEVNNLRSYFTDRFAKGIKRAIKLIG